MRIIVVYVVLVLIGEFVSYLIGRGVEMYSINASMPVFLACFFAVFGIAWMLAVRLTEPKRKHA